MIEDEDHPQVSFPVTIWYVPETGNIHVLTRKEPEREIQISPDPRAPDGHAELYLAMLNMLMDDGANSDIKLKIDGIARLLARARPSR